ncbi:DUF4416 family protein [Thermosulfuriphilus sp.]
MSHPQSPLPAKPIASILGPSRDLVEEALEQLEGFLGPLSLRSPWYPFNLTDYYEMEFGPKLIRIFGAFAGFLAQEDLPLVKHRSYELEKALALKGRRRVNIDPGYLLPERLVLATFKNYSHRIYLGRGVYADLTLIYQRGSYRPLPWTYPDYARDGVPFFNQVRGIYLAELKKERLWPLKV